MRKRCPIPEELIAKLNYDPVSGELTWNERAAYKHGIGHVAGHISRKYGYRLIHHKNRQYRGHRIAWQICFDSVPDVLDHINGDRADNRLINLRESSTKLNGLNRNRHRDGHLPGAYAHHQKWVCRVNEGGRIRYVGIFSTEAEAHAAWLKEQANG